MNLHDVETNVGPDQQDTAHELAQEHAQKVAASAGTLADVTPLTQDEVDALVADYLENGTEALVRVGPERILATVVLAKLSESDVR